MWNICESEIPWWKPTWFVSYWISRVFTEMSQSPPSVRWCCWGNFGEGQGIPPKGAVFMGMKYVALPKKKKKKKQILRMNPVVLPVENWHFRLGSSPFWANKNPDIFFWCSFLPDTNIAPTRKPSQKEHGLPTIHFQVVPAKRVPETATCLDKCI